MALLVALAASVGCASARIRKENERALAAADARVLEGCYDCLQDARRVYERLSTVKNVTGVVTRLFETNVLIAVREEELGLDSRAAVGRARALIPRLPASVDAARVLALAEAVMPDGNAVSLRAEGALRASRKPFVERLDGELAWVEQASLTPAVRTYLALAVDCSYPDRYKDPTDSTNALSRRRALPVNAPPLLAYRAAHCAKQDTLALKRVLLAVPTFDEAAYALGQAVVWFAGETGGEDARQDFARAHARFPRAAGITFLSGWLDLNTGDCDEAVRFYDSTLAIVPMHERALIQKTICLSRTHQDSAAIASATRFISLETADIADGYYWRAVSRLRRRELDLARSDIEAAKARSRTGEYLTLAGIIEHEQSNFSVAETDLRGARAAWKGYENCTAAFYLGSVLTKREAWSDAAASYDSAMVCYEDKAGLTDAMIAKVRASTKGSAPYRARRIASLESELADLRKRYYTSSFNAASMNARLANFDRAGELLGIASLSSDLANQVAKLRDQIAQASRPATPQVARPRPVPRSPR